MRKIIAIVFFFFWQNSFCQEYNFDNFLEYKSINGASTNFYLINTQDNSYYLAIYYGKETTYGKILDFKRNIIHENEVVNLENTYQFNYLYSKNINFDSWNNNFVVETSEKIIDSTKTEYKFKVFKNKRKKKVDCEIELQIENSDDLFNNNILNSLSHYRLKNIDFKINKGTLLNFKVNYKNGFKSEVKLYNKQKINTLITLSKKQLIYK